MSRPPASQSPPPTARAWQRMLSGRRLDLLAPDPADIAIEDIAHGLARVARWNGQTVGAHALSVAQHAVLVEAIAADVNRDWPNQWRLAALLHDAPEYVIGDLISPFKAAIGLDYRAFEARLLAAVHARFGLPHPLPDAITRAIKDADRQAAYIEATGLAGFARQEADAFFGPPPELRGPLGPGLDQLEAMPAEAAQKAFLERFAAISGA